MGVPELLPPHLEAGLEQLERGAKAGGDLGEMPFVVHDGSESTLAPRGIGMFLDPRMAVTRNTSST